MKPHGTYKLAYRRAAAGAIGPQRMAEPRSSSLDALLDGFARREVRVRRLLDSLRTEILEGGGGSNLRIRRVFKSPREIFRLELELPELGYQRTTFLDRDALEELLEADEVREIVESGVLGG